MTREVAGAHVGMTIAGSRSAAYLEAQRRIAVTIRNMYEVGQRVPPTASAMSLSAAQAWDSSHREVIFQPDVLSYSAYPTPLRFLVEVLRVACS